MKNEIKKFGYAVRGLRILFAGERHAQIHLIAAVFVIAAGLFFKISHQEWTIIAIAVAAVITAEAFNTGIEKLCDIVQPERDHRIRDIKDIAAGAVLMVSIGAAVVGLLIFIPYLR